MEDDKLEEKASTQNSLYEVFTRPGHQGDWDRRMHGEDRETLVGFYCGLKMKKGEARLTRDGTTVETRAWLVGETMPCCTPGDSFAGFDWTVKRRKGVSDGATFKGDPFSKAKEAEARGREDAGDQFLSEG